MRISDWSSDVCSSDLVRLRVSGAVAPSASTAAAGSHRTGPSLSPPRVVGYEAAKIPGPAVLASAFGGCCGTDHRHIERSAANASRSEEHTSELQSLMRTSYAVFCLKNKNNTIPTNRPTRLETT